MRRTSDGHGPMNDAAQVDPEGWVDRHGDSLYRFALFRLRAPDRAADVVQETFLEALRARETYAGLSSERTWLLGILRHKIVDQIRRSSRETAKCNGVATNGAETWPFDARGHWKKGPESWAGDPSREIETKEFWEVFSGCMSKLPQGIADAFILRELDGLSADQVQDALGITPANFWKRLHRARFLLRQCLESSWFSPRTKLSTPCVKGRSNS
jgi:RNA polymerase sigma-70 factor (ECF subfamily)